MHDIFFVHDHQESPLARLRFLEMSGFRVSSMKSGAECLRRLTNGKPDLILMDILLEGQNGFAICRSIRSLFSPAELPIVLCSSVYRASIFREEAFAAGAQAYVQCPVKLDDLVAEVVSVITHRPTDLRAA